MVSVRSISDLSYLYCQYHQSHANGIHSPENYVSNSEWDSHDHVMMSLPVGVTVTGRVGECGEWRGGRGDKGERRDEGVRGGVEGVRGRGEGWGGVERVGRGWGRGEEDDDCSCYSNATGHSIGPGCTAVGSAGIGHPLLLCLPAGVPPSLVGGTKWVWLRRYLNPPRTVESESVFSTPRAPEGVPEVGAHVVLSVMSNVV